MVWKVAASYRLEAEMIYALESLLDLDVLTISYV